MRPFSLVFSGFQSNVTAFRRKVIDHVGNSGKLEEFHGGVHGHVDIGGQCAGQQAARGVRGVPDVGAFADAQSCLPRIAQDPEAEVRGVLADLPKTKSVGDHLPAGLEEVQSSRSCSAEVRAGSLGEHLRSRSSCVGALEFRGADQYLEVLGELREGEGPRSHEVRHDRGLRRSSVAVRAVLADLRPPQGVQCMAIPAVLDFRCLHERVPLGDRGGQGALEVLQVGALANSLLLHLGEPRAAPHEARVEDFVYRAEVQEILREVDGLLQHLERGVPRSSGIPSPQVARSSGNALRSSWRASSPGASCRSHRKCARIS